MSNTTKAETLPRHDSVLLHEAVTGLMLEPSDVVVDATVGGAGHFAALSQALGPSGMLIGIDADAAAIARGEVAAKDARATVHLIEDNFRNLSPILDQLSIASIDASLFDLGWSGYQLTSGRGFSFREDEPLLMTYGKAEEGMTAADVVNSSPEETLADLIYEFGEERFARKIAHGIVEARAQAPILTTRSLADVVEQATPGWYRARRLHPATKTFQALRIYVNDELGALREGLTGALENTAEGGRIAVISFHSIEDRIVKQLFRDAHHAGVGILVNKKPITASDAELERNPRARSAKLRIFEKRHA